MAARSAIVGALLLATFVLAGCGDSRSATENTMENRFDQIDYQMSRLETGTSSYNLDHIEAQTQKFIALVRRYQDELGPAEAKRRLTEKADELRSYCLPCVSTLEDEAKTY